MVGMVDGARQADMSISEGADVIGFPNKTVSRVSRDWCQTENILKYHITTKSISERTTRQTTKQP